MTPADLDLSRRLVAVPGIWRAGMLTSCGRIVAVNNAAGCALVVGEPHFPERVSWAWVAFGKLGDIDLTDGPTKGALLDVAREMWHCDDYRRLTVEVAGAGWCIIVRNGRHRPPSRARPGWDLDRVAHPPYLNAPKVLADECPTEGAALALAILAAPALAATAIRSCLDHSSEVKP